MNRLVLLTVLSVCSLAEANPWAEAMAARPAFRNTLLQGEAGGGFTATLAGGLQLAQAAGRALPLGSLTREQLQEEWRLLDAARPSLAGSIGMLAAGVGMGIAGLFCAYFAAIGQLVYGLGSSSISTVAIVFIGVGAALVIGGAVLAIIGGIKLASTLRERRAIGEQMDDIQRQLDGLDSGGNPLPPPPTNVFLPVRPQVVLARF